MGHCVVPAADYFLLTDGELEWLSNAILDAGVEDSSVLQLSSVVNSGGITILAAVVWMISKGLNSNLERVSGWLLVQGVEFGLDILVGVIKGDLSLDLDGLGCKHSHGHNSGKLHFYFC